MEDDAVGKTFWLYCRITEVTKMIGIKLLIVRRYTNFL